MKRIWRLIRSNIIFWQLIRRARYLTYRLLPRLQSLKPYRLLARNLARKWITYSTATVGDAPALSRFYEYESFAQQGDPIKAFTREIESLKDQGCILIASVRDRLAGALVIRQLPGNILYPGWWIFRLLVRTEFRGWGIGRGLVQRAMREAFAQGAARVSLLVYEYNKSMVKLCHSMGFQRISIPELDYQLEKAVQRGANRRIIMSIVTHLS